MSVGGSGGSGGAGGSVNVSTSGAIGTTGSSAAGILAQSVGGGGGAGGFSIGAGASIIASLGVSVGGTGGTGGAGGGVDLTSSSSVSTKGASSDGILAQSVGGGGGTGGFSLAGSVALGVIPEIPVSAGVSVSVGGSGGTGGASGNVSVTSNGQLISTTGNYSRGIFAQSVGGGGGTGGFSGALTFAVDAKLPVSFAVSVGGSGGAGNTAGSVDVHSAGNISTSGPNAEGILAQSIGGGGGNGAFSAAIDISAGTKDVLGISNISLSVGGNGGTGSNGGTVHVNSTGSWISTSGISSTGILAQSIGGGGGNGGISLSLTGALGVGAQTFGDVPVVSMGCKAGGGGDAGFVLVTDSTNISTKGDYAHGILAQSIGGGGGTGGTKITGSAGINVTATSASMGFSFGASGTGGGGGGKADAVTVTESLAPGETAKYISTQGLNAVGILAQSIGGGGGSGGFSLSGGMSVSTSVAYLPSFGINSGSSGGAGGSAGAVSVTGASTIGTLGESSPGILAQSVGGGGGNGGISINADLTAKVTIIQGLSVNMGGDGGSGGNGSQVSVVNNGNLTTTAGNSSPGILAQSVGGGGGNGGGTVGLSVGVEAAVVPPLSASMGGKGGSGGTAAKVSVVNNGSIGTGAVNNAGVFSTGNDSPGILAQSIGGGGGNGGFTIIGRADIGAIIGGTSLSFGGAGGAGNTSGDVEVNSAAGTVIRTMGDRSAGIFAQSVGGGGGNGGFSIAGGVTSGIELSLAEGGNGGTGGNAGAVTVTNVSSISTGHIDPNNTVHGHDSAGILAQSIGGGGGSGSFSISAAVGTGNASISIGGSGGGGGNGGNVTITSTGESITTLGDRSAGIFGQSVGGGGGIGGFSIAGGLGINSTGLALSYGGKGGTGGAAGNVVIQSGAGNGIQTGGDDSQGILAQSIGGGGGGGSFSIAGELALGGKGITVNLGSGGGGGGNGGSVTVNDTGKLIVTSGARSAGIEAQSIGGGGGTSGLSAGAGIGAAGAISLTLGNSGAGSGNSGTVSVTTGSVIVTDGNDSAGILAQSIGGGGGTSGVDVSGNLAGASSINIALGSSGTGDGKGGNVSIVSGGASIITSGARSHGIVAQSIGGGGGIGSIGVAGSVGAGSAAVTLGGTGGGTGDSGSVSIQNSSGTQVTGSGAIGILAQGIGGGGGIVGSTALTSAGTVTVGGAAGTSGNGGQVTIANSGSVTTSSAGGYGIVAQSIGGGGGLVAYAGDGISGINLAMPAGDGTNSGSGAGVTVTNTGAIATTGPAAIGIVAQSIGGGGGLDAVKGNAGSAGGTGSGGAVTIGNTANIVTQGPYAHGIFAQSAGTSGSGAVNVTHSGTILTQGAASDGIVAQSTSGAVSVTVQNGLVQGGSGTGSAIRIREGAINTLVNYGTLVSKDGPLGNAVIATTGDETVNNFGTVAGTVDLGAGNNTFNNKAGSWLLPGATVNLGAAGTLTNQGTISPGGLERVLTTAVTGKYVQQSSGVYTVDIDTRTGTADRINVSGTAAVGGWVAPNIANKGFALPGAQQVTILSGAGGVTSNGLQVIQPSAVAQYRLLYPNATDVVLSTSVNFAPVGLTGNQTAIANNITAIQLAGGSASFAPVVARLFSMPTVQSLGEALDRLSPAPFMSVTSAATYSNVRFADEMLSCGGRAGDHRFAREVACTWARISGSDTHVRGSSGNLGYDRNAYSISTGLQRQITGDFLGGLALSYENSSTDMSDYGRSTGNQVLGGVVLKNRWGGTIAALGLTGGYGWYDTKRYVDLPYPGVTATSTQGMTFLSGRVRLAHAFEWRKWYLRPILDGTINYARMGGFTESGAGGANLSVDGRSETTVSARPALEVGGELSFENGILARPYIRGGLFHIFSGTSPDITAHFEGAPANVPPFTVSTRLDTNMAYVSAGVDVLSTRGMVLRLDYSGLYSGNVTSGTGSFKLSIPF